MRKMILKVAKGPFKGKSIPLKDKLTVGKQDGDFLIKDEALSSPHVQIIQSDDQFTLHSAKGLKENILCDGIAVSFLVLRSGMSFQLGSTLFQVIEGEGFNLSTYDIFSQKLDHLAVSLENEERPLNILKKPFQIKIEKGTQSGEVWDVGYLPRKIGFTDSDLLLFDCYFKDVYFDLLLEKNKVYFSTPYKDHILFNYKHLQKTLCKNGDIIIVGSSYLRFIF